VTATTPGPHVVGDPTALGIDPHKLDELLTRAQREIDSGLLPSCQIAVARNGQLVAYETFGDARANSRYVIFSCTKGLTAGAVWLLMGEGALDVTAKVVEIVPEFGTNGKDVITVEQLLLHTAGFPNAPLNLLRVTTRDERLATFAKWRLNWEPGSRFEYHPTSAHWVLGEIVERISGKPLGVFFEERIARPLGLRRVRIGEPAERQGDINTLVGVGELPTAEALEAATGIAGLDLASIIGEVTLDALLSFNLPSIREQGVPGGGAVSTAADLALYYQGLLRNPGGLWDADVLADGTGTVRNDFPDPIRGNPAHRSRGLMIAGDGPDAQLRGYGHGQSPRTFGHDGAGGQIAWADPDTGISFCYLTNGLDQDVLREGRRKIGLSTRASALVHRRTGR
jgi:CubicO group peptidase (beta-lactamase class C family)